MYKILYIYLITLLPERRVYTVPLREGFKGNRRFPLSLYFGVHTIGIMAPVPTFSSLCPPARLYFVISIITMTVMLFQNIGNENIYCLGNVSCNVPSVTIIFIIKLMYVLFWTWVLNLICQSGNTTISWLLVLFPLILFFILILIMIMSLPMS